MAKRFTAEEKGKSITGNPTAPQRIRIRAPDFDPAELIKDNLLTLVGRLTNPKEQRMDSVLPYLAKKWDVNLSSGSDLGRDCFQFRINKEDDIQEILRNRPYQFGRWMIIVQRWEPIISPTFPSQIPFWINIKGIPLHYWHEKVVRNIGLELGELESYAVTRDSARVRVIMDGLKPLAMEPTLDFDTGEESVITLEYERLGNHCTYCYRLSHLQSQCPEKPCEVATTQVESREMSTLRRDLQTHDQTSPRASRGLARPQNQPFKQRVDRHGRPFGERISMAASRPSGPRNKIAPAAPPPRLHNSKEDHHLRDDQRDHTQISPPYSRRHLQQRGTEQQIGDSPAPQLSPRFQWKAKSPPREQDATSHQLRNSSSRPSLGRNLERTDFSPPQNVPSKEVGIRGGYNPSANLQWREKTPTVDQEATSQQRQIYPPRQNQEHIVTLGEASLLSAIPSKEQVMEELREVTLQYLNVEDPTERAARQKRVLQSEMDGTVEETAANIIHASTAAALATFTLPTPQELPSLPQATSPNNGGTSQVRRRGRTAKTTTARKVIRLSPKTYSGMGSRKRNLAQLQAAASPGPSNKPATKPARKQRRATTAVRPPVVLIPPIAKPQMDFHLRNRDLP